MKYSHLERNYLEGFFLEYRWEDASSKLGSDFGFIYYLLSIKCWIWEAEFSKKKKRKAKAIWNRRMTILYWGHPGPKFSEKSCLRKKKGKEKGNWQITQCDVFEWWEDILHREESLRINYRNSENQEIEKKCKAIINWRGNMQLFKKQDVITKQSLGEFWSCLRI